MADNNLPPKPPFPPIPPRPHPGPWGFPDTIFLRPHDPDKPCCDDDDKECVCVTENDVENWNNTKETVDANKDKFAELDKIGELADKLNEIAASLDVANWNWTYHRVEENAPNWDEAYKLAKELSEQDFKVYTGYGLTGDGSEENPVELNSEISITLEHVLRCLLDLYGDYSDLTTRRWATRDEFLMLGEKVQENIKELQRQASEIVKIWYLLDGGGGGGEGQSTVYDDTGRIAKYVTFEGNTVKLDFGDDVKIISLDQYEAGDGIRIEENTISATQFFRHEPGMNLDNYSTFSGCCYNEE